MDIDVTSKLGRRVANTLTVSRLICIPFILIQILNNKYSSASLITLLACTSDILDGIVARKWAGKADYGQAFDSTVDFIMLISIAFTLYKIGNYPCVLIIFMCLSYFSYISKSIMVKEAIRSRTGRLTGVLTYLTVSLSLTSRVLVEENIYRLIDRVMIHVLIISLVLTIIENTINIIRVIRNNNKYKE